jgi:spore coat polysaccharide biosynthesis protein SpsF (cytidylyltransferase family)
MKTVAIIPTRLDSSRLPDKALLEIEGKPVLQHIYERLMVSRVVDEVGFAIADDPHNLPIIQLATSLKKCRFMVGHPTDVTARTLRAAEIFEADIIVDVSHDCPLVCPSITRRAVIELKSAKADYCSNVIARSWPDGFDVQAYTIDIYRQVEKLVPKDSVYRIHTGWNIINSYNEFPVKPTMVNISAPHGHYFPEWALCLDYPEDLQIIENIFHHFKFAADGKALPTAGHIIDYLKDNRELMEINKNCRRNEPEDG